MAGNELPTEYDEIILGTGLQESILAAALARIGHRVLHLDRNDYYSGDWAGFHLRGLLDWIQKNTSDEADGDAPQPDEFNNLLQDGERLVTVPHHPKTAFNIEVKRYVEEGEPQPPPQRPLVIPPQAPAPAAVDDGDNPPEEQQGAQQDPNNASVDSGEVQQGASNASIEIGRIRSGEIGAEGGEESVTHDGTAEQTSQAGDISEQSSEQKATSDGDHIPDSAGIKEQGSSDNQEQSEEGVAEASGDQSQARNEEVAAEGDNSQGASAAEAEGGSPDGAAASTAEGGNPQGAAEGGSLEGAAASAAEGGSLEGAAASAVEGASPQGAAAAVPARRVWTWADIERLWRKFNIDLAPKLMFCRGSMVELLVQSRISRYAEFKAVTRILTHINGKLEQVPCSRSDVFSSKYVTMLEKRMLMRLIEFCLNYQNLQDEFEAFKDKPFEEFLKSRKVTPKLQHFVIHSIAMVNASTPTEQALQSMQYFLRSLGRYGNTAFLWTIYGSGELPQCFCRMCAVFAGIYMLRSLPKGLIMDSENNCKGIIDPEGRRLTCNHLIMEHSYVPPSATAVRQQTVSRGVFITNKSLRPSNYDEITFLTVPPPDAVSNPVRVIELNWAACAAPKDLFLVHLTCKGTNTASEDLQYTTQQLFQPLTQDEEDFDSDKPKVLWSLFFNQVDTSECDDNVLAEGVANNAMVTAGPGTSVGFEHAVNQARRLFERVCPGEEFLPPAPDPEDIIYEDPARHNPGNHKEVGFETPSSDNEAKPGDDSESKENDDSNDQPSDESQINTKESDDSQADDSKNQVNDSQNQANDGQNQASDSQNTESNSESQTTNSDDKVTSETKDDNTPSSVSAAETKES